MSYYFFCKNMEESIKISALGRNKLRKIFGKLPTVIKKDISALIIYYFNITSERGKGSKCIDDK